MIKITVGKVVVENKPRQLPTRETVKNFLSYGINVIESHGYSVYIGGSAVYDFENAQDLDVYLTGTIRSLSELEDLFHDLHLYVLENCCFLLDMRWTSSLDSVIDWNGTPVSADIDFIQLSHYHYVNTEKNIDTKFQADTIPGVKKLTDWLIQANWDNGKIITKSKQLECFKKYKTLPKIPAREFLNSLG